MIENGPYRRQVALLMRVLPIVAQEKCFALKGGTAINLFIRDMPRLSVDAMDRNSYLRTIKAVVLIEWALLAVA